MALFQFTWLRKLVRRHTTPIPEYTAHTWKQRLSLAYMFLAWNAFGFVCYMVFKGKADYAKELKSPEELALSPAQQWARTLGIKDAKVYRVKGFNVHEYEIHEDDKSSDEKSAD